MEDRLSDLQAKFQREINLLHTEIDVLKKVIQYGADEINQLNSQVNRLTMESSSPKHRSRRSVTLNDDDVDSSTSSLSRLEISPTNLPSMDYGDFRINIYAHSSNDRQMNNLLKRYYYSPLCVLNHKSVKSSFNHVTNQAQVRFPIEMWNSDIEKAILKHTSALVNHPLTKNQIQVLPIEDLKLVPDVPGLYNISKSWIKYQHLPRSVNFTLTCQNRSVCDRLADQMRSGPHQFDYLKLVLRLESHTSKRREVLIRFDSAIKGDLIAKLKQRYPEQETVILTAADEKRLVSESLSNIVVEIFHDFEEEAIIAPASEKRIQDILMDLMESSKVSIKEQSLEMWKSVFWNDDNYRPDKIAKTMNEIYKKLDENQKRSLLKLSIDKTKVATGASFGSIGFNVDVQKENGEKYSNEELAHVINESKETVVFEGEKFIPKQMDLSRINLSKLTNSKVFQQRNIQVSYNTTIVSMKVNIKENLGNEFVDEIFRVQTELNGDYCFNIF